MTQEALKLALEALQGSLTPDFLVGQKERKDKAITAIKQALAQKQEPVAWTLADKVRQDLDRQSCPDAFMRIAVESIVKHHPPQRTWVGLTDEDICMFSMWLDDKSDVAVFTAIEAKLKELNT
jgi:hypothetical protein